MSSTTDERRKQPYTADEIARARELRRSGWGIQQISDKLGMGTATISKFCADIPKPRTPDRVKVSTLKYDRQQRQLMIDEKTMNREWADDSPPPSDWKPDRLPATAEGFDVTGLFPDPHLVAYALQVAERYIEDKAKGRIFDGVPIEVQKSMQIWATTLRPWDQTWWRENRSQWVAIRSLCEIGIEEVAKRTGISASSISRYESGSRTPDKAILERMRIAYWSILSAKLDDVDMALTLNSYIETYSAEHGTDPAEEPFDVDDCDGWVARGTDFEDFTIDHIHHLRHVRSLCPYPAYRQPTAVNLWLIGFAGDDIDDIEAAAI